MRHPMPLPTERCLTPDDAHLVDQFTALPHLLADEAREAPCPRWLGWLLLGLAGEVGLVVWWLWR